MRVAFSFARRGIAMSVFCEECGKFKYSTGTHKCPPKWDVFVPDWHGPAFLKPGDAYDPSTIDWDDGSDVLGMSSEDAAEKYIEREGFDDAEPREVVVFVRSQDSGSVHRINVTPEYTIEYHTDEVKEWSCDDINELSAARSQEPKVEVEQPADAEDDAAIGGEGVTAQDIMETL
jgi:hypothetical protein